MNHCSGQHVKRPVQKSSQGSSRPNTEQSALSRYKEANFFWHPLRFIIRWSCESYRQLLLYTKAHEKKRDLQQVKICDEQRQNNHLWLVAAGEVKAKFLSQTASGQPLRSKIERFVTTILKLRSVVVGYGSASSCSTQILNQCIRLRKSDLVPLYGSVFLD